MKIKVVVVDFEMSSTAKRLILQMVVGIAILGGIGAMVYASLPHPSWSDGDTLYAADLTNNFTSLDGRITTLENRDQFERASLGSDGTVSSQSGSWISLVNHAATGSYVIAFATGVFSATPTCIATALSGNQVSPSIECFDASATGIECSASAGSEETGTIAAVDTGIALEQAGMSCGKFAEPAKA